jgi:hypothetical protein
MRQKFLLASLAFILSLVLLPPSIYAQPPTQGTTSSIIITVDPSSEMLQGRAAILRVWGADLTNVQATFLSKLIFLHPMGSNNWVGFISVDMDTTVGIQPLDVFAWTEGSETPTRTRQDVEVLFGGFDRQEIPIPFDLEPLLDPELNAENFATIGRSYNRITPERLFTTFDQPLPGPAISFFGGYRNYNNGQLLGRHTGADYRAVTGTAVGAASDGRVVLVRRLPIHGNHIVIDHGWGIMTGYSHLSEMLVVPGQLVRKGETIGLVGATGRVQGPHLHFEVAVNGFWVDPIMFLDLGIPAPSFVAQN